MKQLDLSLLEKLKPCMFRYDPDKLKGSDNKLHFGFIAQDLVELFPVDEYGIVVINPHNNNLMVNYNEFIGMLTKWQQQLYSIIKVQQNQINALQEKIERFEGRNDLCR
jgi:hypothetical protein